MMIELTVKTLDSQNHSFTVSDDITVNQFKDKIAEQINIPAETQRIIYCGRVLKDELKLSEYDVNGKVVHLVQRAPPNSQAATRTTSPQPQRRNIRSMEHGMYVGSMAFPTNLMESQGIVPPPPTHSLAASRLNVAKRMFRRAEAVLNLLENPQSRATEQPPAEEPQEEVTPILEARVIVPGSSLNEPIDNVLSELQNTLFNAAPMLMQDGAQASGSNRDISVQMNQISQNSVEMDSPPMRSASSTPEGASPVSTSTENLTADQRPQGNSEGRRRALSDSAVASSSTSEAESRPIEEAGAAASGAAGGASAQAGASTQANGNANLLAENASRTTEMADLLDTLARLQLRLAPFLQQYRNFMRNDPSVPAEDVRKTQALVNRVSETLHFLAHAYHSLSDIIVRVRTPPPRPLLCRPILIQRSAVVQTGFPIQVEAQINISPDNLASLAQNSSTPSTTSTTATTAASDSLGGAPLHISGPSLPHMLGLPLGFEIPIGIHRAGGHGGNQGGNNGAAGNNGSTGATSRTSAAAGGNNATATTTASQGQQPGGATAAGGPFNNPNFDFYMEVTPESITIDSLETTLLGGNQAGDALRGALNGPPPEFLQSIMQMAGHIMNRTNVNVTTEATTASSPSATTTSAAPSSTDPNQSTQSSVNTTVPNSGQNSQARGNTQTNPTTATHTRSTARPHVHLAQHAFQGGFDPFLPCNSHHVSSRRPRTQSRAASVANNQNNNATRAEGAQGQAGGIHLNANQLNPIYNIVQGIVNSFRNAYRQRPPGTQVQGGAPGGAVGGPSAQQAPPAEAMPAPPPVFSLPFLPHIQNMVNNISDSRVGPQGPTISQILQQLQPEFDESYVQGESIFSDLIMLLSRNLTIGDMVQLSSNQLEPLVRIRSELRNFFLTRVLDGAPNVTSIDRGVNRFITEMQPFIDDLGQLQVRDDIDIVKSVQMLFRNRLPNIISLAASRNANSLRLLVEQCTITLRQLCALVLRASANGLEGVEEVVDVMVRRQMQGMSREIETWVLRAVMEKLRRYVANLSVPESILQPYIVRRIDSVTLPDVGVATITHTRPAEEPMELDEQEASGSSSDGASVAINLQDDADPLPDVEIGSELWHNRVPAEWVPIIVRDTQRQRRQNPQPAFSDAYLSGMPSKRRKIVTASKPQGSLPQVIQESVRRAVTSTSLDSVAPLDVVAQAAGADINIQSAYRELLRSRVQSTLQDNEDFTPERYPNASNFFNKPQ